MLSPLLPAFACSPVMTASTTPPPPAPRPRRRPGRPRKAAANPRAPLSNPSDLARKYRPVALHPDELELVGAASTGGRKPCIDVHAQKVSRFPDAWPHVVRQATDAAVAALDGGYDRVMMDVRRPEMLLGLLGGGAGGEASFSSAHLYGGEMDTRFAMTLDICNAIVARLCGGGGRAGGSRVRPSANVLMFFNDESEAEAARKAAHPAFLSRTSFQVLSNDGPVRSPTDICVVVGPSNRRGDPSIIEAVERIHYTNWNDSNIIILVNPDLFALTGFSTFEGCARLPCFLTDYLSAYYLDPQVFMSKHVNGAMLRCYPRKWEAYMQKSNAHQGAFRLISESDEKPRHEKVLCEFGWRADEVQTDILRPPPSTF